MLGKPESIELIEQPKTTNYKYGKKKKVYDIEIKINKGKVTGYSLYTNKYKTTKGIQIGSKKSEVIKAYGKNYYEREETGGKTLGYFDKNKDFNIEFATDNNKVSAILAQKFNK